MKQIIERLIESVEEETGIKLTTKDFTITAEDDTLAITLWGQSLLEMSYSDGDLEEDDFAEEVIDELFNEHFDLRAKIVELKLDHLNNDHMPNLKDTVLEKLKANKVDQKVLDVLDFEFMDMGYIQGNFSSAGDEEWDFPGISIRVTDFEDLEHYVNIDPYKTINQNVVTEELIKKIRGKI